MKIDELIDLVTNDPIKNKWNPGREGQIMLRDIAFMLNEFKKEKKINLIRNDIKKGLVIMIETGRDYKGRLVRPYRSWRDYWWAYFMLKETYLDMKEAKEDNE